MSRYQPLADFLAGKKSTQWMAEFTDIEAVLGFTLPDSAYRYPAWWANQSGKGHSQTIGWQSAGWKTCALDLERRRVRFEREGGGDRKDGAGRAERRPPVKDGELARLIQEARQLTGITDRDQLAGEAYRALITREAAARLANLGGAMPDLTVPDRQKRSRWSW